MTQLFNIEARILNFISQTSIVQVHTPSFLTSPLFSSSSSDVDLSGTSNSGNQTSLSWHQIGVQYTSSPWYCYGFGPVFAICFSSLLSVFLMDGLLQFENLVKTHLFVYKRNEDRLALLKKQHEEIPWSVQFKELCWQVFGPLNIIVSGVAQRYIFDYAYNGLPSTPLPTATPIGFFLDCYLIATIADFFLYIFHRGQHEIPVLWEKWHSKHHRITVPTAVSTIYIAPEDSFLGAGVALITAQLIVRAHPVTVFFYLIFHIMNTMANHCGADIFLLDLILLKWLPMRVPSAAHDQHHRLGNRGKGAKLYAEFFNWDRIFGTECMIVAKTQGENK